MAEYIEREALKQNLLGKGFFPAIVKSVIEGVPTADVVEVRHGEWVQNDLSVWADSPTDGFPVAVCSVCGMKFCDIINNMDYMFNHCPHCGAKMDGKDGAE
jgi:hypothetical protein